MKRFICATLFGGFLCFSAYAAGPDGQYTVTLEGHSESIAIGTVNFTKDGDGYRYKLTLDDSKFSDQFLSMRPFKCLDGETMICHLAYPYEKGQRISAGDMMDLEYDFLFIARSPSEYGINPYNGRYYRLRITDNGLEGAIYAVDLDILAAPPDDGVTRPLTADVLDELEAERERFGRIVIHR